jgi:hypothetical protein
MNLAPQWPTGLEVARQVRTETPRTLLAFSCGKDSLAAWLVLRPVFDEVIPFYKYLVPDLEFVEEGLHYYEQFFRCHIIRVPHPSLYRMLRNRVFQPPERGPIIAACRLARFSDDDVRDDVAEDVGLSVSPWNAVGTRACDNIQRRMAFTKYGPIRRKKHTYFPVWDMNKAAVVDLIHRCGTRLPAEYRIFGRSFDGLDFRFLYGIKQWYPRDYARILEWFPMADLEVFRYECSRR